MTGAGVAVTVTARARTVKGFESCVIVSVDVVGGRVTNCVAAGRGGRVSVTVETAQYAGLNG